MFLQLRENNPAEHLTIELLKSGCKNASSSCLNIIFGSEFRNLAIALSHNQSKCWLISQKGGCRGFSGLSHGHFDIVTPRLFRRPVDHGTEVRSQHCCDKSYLINVEMVCGQNIIS